MTQNEFNTRLRQEVSEFACDGRNESAAFLIWFLHNIFRLEEQDAIDYVCDDRNDKGIDGIFVDDEDEEIYLFQSKFSPHNNRAQGDNDLRNFLGASSWFRDKASIEELTGSTASIELKKLIERLTLSEKFESGYSINLIFVTNKIFDTNAKEYLSVNSANIDGQDLLLLLDKYTYIADEEIQTEEKDLFLSNTSKIDYLTNAGIKVRVICLPATELVGLEGIEDRTLFSKNVRYGLGKTRVNKEIKKTILNSSEHENVFLYHNGITIICDTLEEIAGNHLRMKNYSIINGCQSVLTFYENRDHITDDVSALVKIIQIEPTSPLVDKITFFTNNQNSISLKDLKSNDRVQKELQRKFLSTFNRGIFYRVKRGEDISGYSEVLDIDFAAQLIESFFYSSPHNTHLKSKLFGEEYSKLFSRKITETKIFLAYTAYNVIEANIQRVNNEKIRGYALAKFFFTHLLAEILKGDPKGNEIISNPDEYVTIKIDFLKESLKKLWSLLTPEINNYIEEYTRANNNFFDYKNVFKSSEFVKEFTRRIKADHERILVRHPEDAFNEIWESIDT